MNPSFISVKSSDYPQIREIFNYYVDNTTVTFETRPQTLKEIKKDYPINETKYGTYMIRNNKEIAGFCFLRPYKTREAYNRTAMVGVYLKTGYERKGIGKSALEFLEKTAIENKIKILIGYITEENTASIRLVEKLDYTKCGHFRNVGEKFGKLLDVVFYQKDLSL